MKTVNLQRFFRSPQALPPPPRGQVDLRVDPATGLLAQMNDDASFTAFGSSSSGSSSSATVETTGDVTYTLTSADNGKVLNFSTGCTVTVPTGLPAGFNVGLVQSGAGQVVVAGSGVTVNSIGGLLGISDQHGTASLLRLPDGTFNLSGSLSA